MNDSFSASYRAKGVQEYFEYHSHHEYEIYFFHGGVCRYLIHNQIYDLEPGDILLMNGLTLHKPNIHLPYEYTRSVVHFSPHWIHGLLQELGSEYLLDPFNSHSFIRTKENAQSKKLEKILCEMTEIRHQKNTSSTMIEIELKVLLVQALIILYQLAQQNHVHAETKKNDKAIHAENIATYIQENFMHPLTLDKIATSLNLSKSYISHLFKEMTGFTVMEYVMGCRLNHAKYLLEVEPDKPIHEVALASGFESAAHFSRYFHAQVGLTATNYRRHRLKLYEK